MILKKKVVALILIVVATCSLAGCDNLAISDFLSNYNILADYDIKENLKTQNNSIVGVWTIEEHVIYDGPMEEWVEDIRDNIYYVGAEFEFTEDGIFRSADGKLSTEYEVLSDNKISCVEINSDKTVDYDYELNGDELVLYGKYTGSYAHYGHANAIYFNRKY